MVDRNVSTIEEAEKIKDMILRDAAGKYCPIRKGNCILECVAFHRAYIEKYEYPKSPTQYNVSGGHCDAYMLVGPG